MTALQNTYQLDTKNTFDQQELDLESTLAMRGISNSSIADDARARLQDAKTRALAAADMQFAQVAGQENRANLSAAQQLGSQNFTDALTRAMSKENIYNTRTQSALQPLQMLLSSLTGMNVAPQAISQLQLPQQGGGGFGGALGAIGGTALGSFLGPLGASAGGSLGAKMFGSSPTG